MTIATPRAADTSGTTKKGQGPLLILWVVSTAVLGTMVLSARELESPSVINGAVSVALLGATTAALWVWLGRVPTQLLVASPVTRRAWFGATLAGAVVVLALLGLTGTPALAALAVVAVVVLIALREPVRCREATAAVLFGGIAAVAGLADAWARADAAAAIFGVLQLPLVVLTLLAGWELTRGSGLPSAHAGTVAAISHGFRAAVRGFAFGTVLSLPWALGNVVNGTPTGDDMRSAWQPLAAALQPGVAEEAWARAFLIPVLYVLFARSARPRLALATAVIVSAYWFAFLHAPVDPMFTLAVGTLYAVPMTLLWLRRGLEVAIGFHVGLDLIRYAGSYLTAKGLWFT